MSLTARDVMTSPVTTVSPSTPLAELARILTEDQISGVPVLDVGSRLVGIVSKTDLLERLLTETTAYTSNPDFRRLFNLAEEEIGSSATDESLDWMPEMAESAENEDLGTVEDIMESEVVTVSPSETIERIAAIMSQDRIHRVVVTEGPSVVGIVTSLDLLARIPQRGKPAARESARPAPATRKAKAKAKRPAARGAKSAKARKPKTKPKSKGRGKAGSRR